MKENLINRLDFIKLKQKDVTYKIPTIEPKNVMAKTIARIVFVGFTLCDLSYDNCKYAVC